MPVPKEEATRLILLKLLISIRFCLRCVVLSVFLCKFFYRKQPECRANLVAAIFFQYLYPKMVKDYILIAEDDEDDQFLLKSAFSEIDYNIDLVFVNNGIDLLNHFREVDNGSISKLPLLLVVDLNMPKKNGKEAIKELSSRNYFRDFTTIIFSTTSNDAEKINAGNWV